MTFTPIPDGTPNWGFELNNALNDLQAQISTNNAANATGDWTPEDNGMIAWSSDSYLASGSTAVTSGQITLVQVSIKKPSTISRVHVGRSADGSGLTGAFLGIYDISGNLIGQTADQSAAWSTGGATPQSADLLVQAPVPAGKYWIAILVTGTTPPTFLRGATGGGQLTNQRTTSATRRLATFGAGLTALPATITPTAMASSFITYCFAVS